MIVLGKIFHTKCYAGTIAKGAALLHQEGAREVYACSTHAVFRYHVHILAKVYQLLFFLELTSIEYLVGTESMTRNEILTFE